MSGVNTSRSKDAPLVFLVAGEASGDQLGANLMAALRDLYNNQIQFVGVGGDEMEAQGLKSLFPMAELSIMGLVEVLPRAPRLYRRIFETTRMIRDMQPAAMVTIDSPGFTFRLVRRLGKLDVPRIHYVAPTVWAWKPGRAKVMRNLFDHLMVLLPFERQYFEQVGLSCTFVGHPAAKGNQPGMGEKFRAEHGLESANVVGVFPGSRKSEVRRMLPVFRDAVHLLNSDIPNLHVVTTVVSSVRSLIEASVRKWSIPVTLIESTGDKRAAHQGCDVALATSGTVTTELAAAGTPMVVGYKMAPLTVAVARRLVKARHMTLVNLVLKKRVIPEFLQEFCTATSLADAARGLLLDPQLKQQQITSLKAAVEALRGGEGDPSYRAAAVVQKILLNTKVEANLAGKQRKLL